MKYKQLHAGFLLSTIRDLFPEDTALAGIWRQLSTFALDSDFPDPGTKQAEGAVLANLVGRGLPTLPSVDVEEGISLALKWAERVPDDKSGTIKFRRIKNDAELGPLIRRAFYIIDPRLDARTPHLPGLDGVEGFPGSQLEHDLAYSSLPKVYGAFVCQLLEPQRAFSGIVPDGLFATQRVDYFLSILDGSPKTAGVIIELDGAQHVQQQTLDRKRDAAAKTFGIDTARIPATALGDISKSPIQPITDYLSSPQAEILRDNYERSPLTASAQGKRALQLALASFAVARIQRVLAEAMRSGVLKANQQEWNIAVIERDVPCARLAIDDFLRTVASLGELKGDVSRVPTVKLRTYTTPEFKACRLGQGAEAEQYGSGVKPFKADLLIDVSTLQRRGFTCPTDEFLKRVRTSSTAIIRSVHQVDSQRQVLCAPSIVYPIPADRTPPALLYFLRNLFRKSGFRDGQMDILRRTLRLESAIALLPTGAGKSLVYQLSALLQPGITLIVDPLRSLMRDQHQNLLTAGIDNTAFISSDLSSSERQATEKQLKEARLQFVYISPERLQIPAFRSTLRTMSAGHFSYCVVDEAHCVSEWGHDFRTAYLRLGENIRTNCKGGSSPLPLIALTGTASFDVLADVQRELDLGADVAIIAPSKYKRDELSFELREADSGYVLSRKAVADRKSDLLINLLRTLPKDFGEKQAVEQYMAGNDTIPNSGIIFCPHVKGYFGVKDVEETVKQAFPQLKHLVGHFAGSSARQSAQTNYEQIQTDFKIDRLRLLVATKAFGMGIDKPNIRFTIHFSMPPSIESFYQEAGRAGRDRNPAHCYLIYHPLDRQLMLSFHQNSFKGIEKETQVLYEILDKINSPATTNLARLTLLIRSTQSDAISLNLWPNQDPTRLYANQSFGLSYGYIDLKTLAITPGRALPSSDEVLHHISSTLEREVPKGTPVATHLLNMAPPIMGIERALESMAPKTRRSIEIPFVSAAVDKIVELLKKTAPQFTHESVLAAYGFTDSPDKFFENLAYRSGDRSYQVPASLRSEIEPLYAEIRTEDETFKAVYRLLVVGCIDDYIVDYNSKTVTITFEKREQSYYLQSLQSYLSRYQSREDLAKLLKQLDSGDGSTYLRKCLASLLNFVYDKIASKRLQAILTMENAIKIGLAGGDFEDYVNTYFDSRYTPELRESVLEYNSELVWEYFDRVNGDPDSLNHLRGACERLLGENPNNGALLTMLAYARFLIPHFDVSSAIEALRKGLEDLSTRQKWDRSTRLKYLVRFTEECVKHDSRLIDHLGAMILADHTEWLKSLRREARGGR